MKFLFSTTVAWLLTSLVSSAIVVDSTRTQNLTPPASGAPWANVGTGNGASGVYLKNGWVISARHVFGDGDSPLIRFGNIVYSGGTTFVLKNPDSSLSDVVLFNIGSAPAGSSEIGLASSPTTTDTLTLIGYGAKRNGGLTNFTYTSGRAKGYAWDTSNGVSKSWGTNSRSASATTTVAAAGASPFTAFPTSFTANGFSGSAQGTLGDSGGGVFVFSQNAWQLAGTINAVGGFDGQPGSTSLNGNATYIADAATYAVEINSHLNSNTLPVLTSNQPALLITSNSGQNLTLKGSAFVSGAKVQIAAQGSDVFSTVSPVTFVDASTLTVRVTATAATTWRIRVVNPEGQPSAALNLPIYQAQTFSSWQSSYFLANGDTSPTADPDGDGLSNLAEYAFGSNPTQASREKAPALGPEVVGNVEYLTLTFEKDLSKSDLTYLPQMTTNLADAESWTDAPASVIDRNGTVEHDKISIPVNATPTYLRVKIAR